MIRPIVRCVVTEGGGLVDATGRWLVGAKGDYSLRASFYSSAGQDRRTAEVLNGLRPSVAGHPVVHILWGEVHPRRGDHNLAADTYARAFASDVGGVGPFQRGTSRRDAAAWPGYGEECRRWGTYETRRERSYAALVQSVRWV